MTDSDLARCKSPGEGIDAGERLSRVVLRERDGTECVVKPIWNPPRGDAHIARAV